MIINQDIMRRDTMRLMTQIDTQIEEVNKQAAQIGIKGHELRYSDGTWPMIPLILAKTQAYATLVQLQAK